MAHGTHIHSMGHMIRTLYGTHVTSYGTYDTHTLYKTHDTHIPYMGHDTHTFYGTHDTHFIWDT